MRNLRSFGRTARVGAAVASLLVAGSASAYNIPLPTAFTAVDIHPTGLPAPTQSVAAATNGQTIIGRVDPAFGNTQLVTWDANTKAFVQTLGDDGVRQNAGGAVIPTASGRFFGESPSPSTGAMTPYHYEAGIPGSVTRYAETTPGFFALARGYRNGLVFGQDSGLPLGFGVASPAYWTESAPATPPTLLPGITSGGIDLYEGMAWDSSHAGNLILGSLNPFVIGNPGAGPLDSHAVTWQLQSGSYSVVTDYGIFGSGNRHSTFVHAFSDTVWLGSMGDFTASRNILFLIDIANPGQIRVLPDLVGGAIGAGMSFTFAYHDGLGEFVGTTFDANGTAHAALWKIDPTNIFGQVDFRVLPPLAGDTSSAAYGIDANGLIVGSSFGNHGGAMTNHAVYWTPVPEPASALLAASGILGLAVRARRRTRRASHRERLRAA